MMRRGVVLLTAVVLGFVTAGPVPAEEPPLQALALTHVGAGQGVFVDAEDGTVLVSVAAERPVHPASVTKVATSLALLERLGPTHRFETRVGTTGPLNEGQLAGDLVVHGGNDPFFVYESAFLLLQRLRALGVARITGRVRAVGPFLLNWQPDLQATRMGRTLRGREGVTAWAAVGDGERLERAALRVDGGASVGTEPEHILVTHRSPPLLHVLKACNGYSNNVLHYASDAIGGPHVVETISRAAVPDSLRDEITIDNGAGAGTTNRLSPRAAVAILRALDRRTQAIGHGITDVLPVSGVDPGTLAERLLDLRRYVVGKTGTFGSVGASALVGLLRSPRYGTVAFAVLNHSVAVPKARLAQDAFVRALVRAVGAEPWPYETATRPAYTLALVE
jgi:D-alanyl-D-alanine carboxypeptidase/D-alanyl-D-alanine-endopeptidase (penicillin-binding protein 4)